jgi:serpin B
VTSPDVGQDELTTRVAENNAFAFDLYQTVREEKENAFHSPYSIALTLAMAYAGARGKTEEEMAETLRYALSQGRLRAAFNALALRLASRGAEPEEGPERRFRLVVANAIWGQARYSFLQEYLDVLAGNYGTGLRLLGGGSRGRKTGHQHVGQGPDERADPEPDTGGGDQHTDATRVD